eukprot:5515202-Prymnesium_polylepis.3
MVAVYVFKINVGFALNPLLVHSLPPSSFSLAGGHRLWRSMGARTPAEARASILGTMRRTLGIGVQRPDPPKS